MFTALLAYKEVVDKITSCSECKLALSILNPHRE
jgi:hypothetical protein